MNKKFIASLSLLFLMALVVAIGQFADNVVADGLDFGCYGPRPYPDGPLCELNCDTGEIITCDNDSALSLEDRVSSLELKVNEILSLLNNSVEEPEPSECNEDYYKSVLSFVPKNYMKKAMCEYMKTESIEVFNDFDIECKATYRNYNNRVYQRCSCR